MPLMNPIKRASLEGAISFMVKQGIGYDDWNRFRDTLAEGGSLTTAELEEPENKVLCLDIVSKCLSAAQKPRDHPVDAPTEQKKYNTTPTQDCDLESTPSLEKGLETPFRPTPDLSQEKPTEYLSIHNERHDTWPGVAYDFCEEDENFISSKIVNRCKLETVDCRTLTTWKFHDLKKSYRKWFTVLEDEDIPNDIMLGKGWDNPEDYNTAQSECSDQEVEESAPYSGTTERFEEPRILQGAMVEDSTPWLDPGEVVMNNEVADLMAQLIQKTAVLQVTASAQHRSRYISMQPQKQSGRSVHEVEFAASSESGSNRGNPPSQNRRSSANDSSHPRNAPIKSKYHKCVKPSEPSRAP